MTIKPAAPKEASERCALLLKRVMSSGATMSSALQVPKLSDVIVDRAMRDHLNGESALLSLLGELKMPESFDRSRDIPRIASALAKQTAVNLQNITSAATIVLSHSTADDVFTGACELSIDLDPEGWIGELNLQRSIALGSIIEKGRAGVLADQLNAFKSRLNSKSLPSRAEMLFRHVPVQHHREIPPSDQLYFRMSRLREADDLRHSIVHGNSLPCIDNTRSREITTFLQEAATVAIRSIIAAYRVPNVWEEMVRLYLPSQARQPGTEM